ncbi:hypothetical protein DSCO28_10970 [Desulfosarcina ovata subsp. sediminis]|uniref:Uncharacterized protein n=1 Tax=Desulfosarcina ovata subsp. sediminis TaxID=885957 RepID=A0A5K7ZI37_9BACT|nr:hypothetical protein DSCO28_10970 [Desulfosarcina ovata subsp. sediminis]
MGLVRMDPISRPARSRIRISPFPFNGISVKRGMGGTLPGGVRGSRVY